MTSDAFFSESGMVKRFKQNDLLMDCTYSAEGKLLSKLEDYGHFCDSYEYSYDEAGHLTQVTMNGKITEIYVYNNLGQRISKTIKRQVWDGNASDCDQMRTDFEYDSQGRLGQAGKIRFSCGAGRAARHILGGARRLARAA